MWNDAGNTPNVHFAYFDTGSIPVVIGLSNLPANPNAKGSPEHPGPNSGYIAYCEGGRLEGQRGRATAFDSDGNVIRQFKGNGGNTLHQANFIDAVRNQDPSILNAEVAIGNDSTGWCNLANIAFRAAGEFNLRDARSVDVPQWHTVLSEMNAHLKDHGLSLEGDQVRLSELLTLDGKTEQFVGPGSEQGNRFLKRTYRDGYEVPSLV